MRNFLTRLTLFSVVIFVINTATEFILSINEVNSFWGNLDLKEKINNQQSKYEDCTHYFLGPSIFYRQIDPNKFEKLLKEQNISSNSYNLSTVGMTPPEDLFVLEQLIQNPGLNSKTVFLALTPIKGLSPDNLFKDRTTYYLNTKTLGLIFDETFQRNLAYKTKAYVFGSYVANYIFKIFSLGRLRNLLIEDLDDFNKDENNLGHKGYLALDDDLVQIKTNRHQQFLGRLDKLESRTKRTIEIFKQEPKLNLNSPHLNSMMKLIQEAEKMNIKLIFVLPPKLNDYTELIHLFHNLPKSNAIDLANPEKFPDFYKAENSFDISHLNKQGAEIFTKVLVEEYLKIKT